MRRTQKETIYIDLIHGWIRGFRRCTTRTTCTDNEKSRPVSRSGGLDFREPCALIVNGQQGYLHDAKVAVSQGFSVSLILFEIYSISAHCSSVLIESYYYEREQTNGSDAIATTSPSACHRRTIKPRMAQFVRQMILSSDGADLCSVTSGNEKKCQIH